MKQHPLEQAEHVRQPSVMRAQDLVGLIEKKVLHNVGQMFLIIFCFLAV